MKDLSIPELDSAPPIIVKIYIWSWMKIPISNKLYQGAKSLYPEYFEEEINKERSWSKIPNVVHVGYQCEITANNLGFFSNNGPESKGIFHFMNNPEELEEYNRKFSEWWQEAEKKIESIWNKYYAEYGFPYAKRNL